MSPRPAERSTPGERVDALCAEVAKWVGVEPERALRLAEEAQRLAEESGDDRARGKSGRAKANALHFSGGIGEAQEHYQRALELFLGLGDELQAAITRSSALLNLAYLGESDLADAWYGSARHSFLELGDPQRAAILEHNYANVLYRRDLWPQALARYRSAYVELRRLGKAFDAAVCLRNIAVCRISLEQFDQALAAYRECVAYAAEEGLDQLRREVDYNIAYLFYLRGEYSHAIDLFTAARREAEAAGDAYHGALCDLDLSELYLEVNLISDADRLARRGSRAFARLGLSYEAAKAATNAAVAIGRQGKTTEALRELANAREIFAAERNRLWPALIDFYRAVLLARGQNAGAALPLALAALEVFTRDGFVSRTAMCEILLADLALARGEVDEARRQCDSARDRLQAVASPALQVRVQRTLGEIEESEGDHGAALAAYRRAAACLAQSWSELAGDDLKIAFTADKKELFESLVALTLATASTDDEATVERTFEHIETAKSRALQDLLGFRPQPTSAMASLRPELAERARILRQDLHWLYHQVDRQPQSAEPRTASAAPDARRLLVSIRRREEELLEALRGLRSADPELAAMGGGAPALEAIREALPVDGVLVEYFIARRRLLAVVIDRSGLTIHRLGAAQPVRELQGLLEFQLTRPRLRPQLSGAAELDGTATQHHLRALWELLIAPLRQHLENRQQLIVVPHGFLHHLPFHALHDGDGYLLDRWSISYAPSAAVYQLCASKRTEWEERSLVMGVADQRAPRIEEEAQAVAELLPQPTLLMGEDATIEALAEQGRHARYVHLATHGLFRRDHPMFSAVRLGSTRLALADLYELRLAAELVVLSGCGTGITAVHGADELIGLTRGMLFAGAHSVLVSLWDVDDAATAAMMGVFYRHLGSRHLGSEVGAAAALRAACRELRESFPDPAHWAPFVLVGRAGGEPSSRAEDRA